MDTGGDRGERPDDGGGSGISRRHFLAGSAMAIGGSSALVSGTTSARFADDAVASSTPLRIDGNPTLNYDITENHPNGNNNHVQFDIAYEVEWVSNFDRVDVYVDSNPNDDFDTDATYSDSATNGPQSDVFSTVDFWDGGSETYEFIIEVYDSTGLLIREKVTHTPGQGEPPSDGEFGNANSPTLDTFTVEDQTGNKGTRYVVSYATSNFGPSYTVRGRFENQEIQDDWPDGSDTNSEANGDLVFPTGGNGYEGGTVDDTYRITVEILDNNGLVVDSGWVEDTSGDGNDSSYP